MKTLEELQNELGELKSKLEGYKNKTEWSDEERTEISNLYASIKDVSAQVKAVQEMDEMEALLNSSPGRKVAPKPAGAGARAVDPKKAFSTAGEFLNAVRIAGQGGAHDERLYGATNREKVGQDGGFLVAPEFLPEIQKKVEGDESLLSFCRQFRTAGNNLSYPTSEVAPWNADGIQAYWEGEEDQYTESKAKFNKTKHELHKLTALVPVTDELLEDTTALEDFINVEAGEAMMHKVNSAILRGNGVGMPTGILNSDFKVKVAKEGGQAADTVRYENIVKMWAAALPGARRRGVWIYNPKIEEQLRLMQFVSGAASPVPVYLPPGGLNDTPYGSLMGRPVIPMLGGSSQLGDEGDIMFVDFFYYHAALKSGTEGVRRAVSTHVYFDRDKTAFKFTFRMDGKCPYKSPVITEFGNHSMSGFVTLEDR